MEGLLTGIIECGVVGSIQIKYLLLKWDSRGILCYYLLVIATLVVYLGVQIITYEE
jgi:hypothetical protein